MLFSDYDCCHLIATRSPPDHHRIALLRWGFFFNGLLMSRSCNLLGWAVWWRSEWWRGKEAEGACCGGKGCCGAIICLRGGGEVAEYRPTQPLLTSAGAEADEGGGTEMAQMPNASKPELVTLTSRGGSVIVREDESSSAEPRSPLGGLLLGEGGGRASRRLSRGQLTLPSVREEVAGSSSSSGDAGGDAGGDVGADRNVVEQSLSGVDYEAAEAEAAAEQRASRGGHSVVPACCAEGSLGYHEEAISRLRNAAHELQAWGHEHVCEATVLAKSASVLLLVVLMVSFYWRNVEVAATREGSPALGLDLEVRGTP